MNPSIGRTVHFVAGEGDPRGAHYAAVVTHVWSSSCVNLFVYPKGDPLSDKENSGILTSVMLDATKIARRSWHWPEIE